jgi:hypothetical protein
LLLSALREKSSGTWFVFFIARDWISNPTKKHGTLLRASTPKEDHMRRTTLLLSLLAPVILINAATAFAWDGKRKGFVLGVGAGGGLASNKPYANSSGFGAGGTTEGERESKFAIMTDFKIGYAPSNQVAIFWMSKVAWFGYDVVYQNQVLQSYTIANGIGGVAVAYYFNPEGPSPYLTGGLGFSTYDAPFEENFDGFSGSGFALGAGYEFSKHWSVEGNLSWGSPNTDLQGGELGFKSLAVRVTVNVLGY